jgi:hypothetical protein
METKRRSGKVRQIYKRKETLHTITEIETETEKQEGRFLLVHDIHVLVEPGHKILQLRLHTPHYARRVFAG